MYIIIKKDTDGNEQVVNIIQTTDESFVTNWINQYINQFISQINNSNEPITNNKHSDIVYLFKNNTDGTFTVMQKTTTYSSGYIYNSTKQTTTELFNIRYIYYDGDNLNFNTQKNTLYLKLNNEINNRVLKQLDKESLYQVFINLQQRMSLANNWNYENYTHTLSEIINKFKKELYSNVAKKLHRFGTTKQVLPPIRSNNGSCALEAKKNQ